jgi:hypothetical protein
MAFLGGAAASSYCVLIAELGKADAMVKKALLDLKEAVTNATKADA